MAGLLRRLGVLQNRLKTPNCNLSLMPCLRLSFHTSQTSFSAGCPDRPIPHVPIEAYLNMLIDLYSSYPADTCYIMIFWVADIVSTHVRILILSSTSSSNLQGCREWVRSSWPASLLYSRPEVPFRIHWVQKDNNPRSVDCLPPRSSPAICSKVTFFPLRPIGSSSAYHWQNSFRLLMIYFYINSYFILLHKHILLFICIFISLVML